MYTLQQFLDYLDTFKLLRGRAPTEEEANRFFGGTIPAQQSAQSLPFERHEKFRRNRHPVQLRAKVG